MQFSCLGESIEKYITFTVPIEREVRRNEKVEIKLQKNYLTYNSLWIPQDLLQIHHQVLSIISMKEFIELNVNLDTIIKNVKYVELIISIAVVFFEYENFKDDLWSWSTFKK